MVWKVFPRNIVNVFHLNESLSELSEKELEILHDDLNEKEKLKECDEKKKENEAQKKKAGEENQWQPGFVSLVHGLNSSYELPLLHFKSKG